MKTIIRSRDSGKAAELLAFAREKDAAVLTQNKRAFKVKAGSLGFNELEILDYEDLIHDNYNENKPIVVHNGDKFLWYLCDKFFGLSVIGFSATEEHPQL